MRLSQMQLNITGITYKDHGVGDFPRLACYLAIGLPELGPAVKLLSIEPHFRAVEPKYGLRLRAEQFEMLQRELPEVIFSRENRNLTFRYNSKVCTADDLHRVASIGHHRDCSPAAVSMFHNYCKELCKRLLLLEKYLEPGDDFNVRLLCEHIKKRQSELSKHPDKLKEQFIEAESTSQASRQERRGPIEYTHAELPDDRFWKLMRAVQMDFLMNGHEQEALVYLNAELRKLSSDELCAFQRTLKSKLAALDTKEHFSYARNARTDDSFLYLRLYIVGLGKEFFSKTLSEPRFTPGGYEGFELLYYAAADAWAFVTSDVRSNFPDL
jgi:hypothetical protein